MSTRVLTGFPPATHASTKVLTRTSLRIVLWRELAGRGLAEALLQDQLFQVFASEGLGEDVGVVHVDGLEDVSEGDGYPVPLQERPQVAVQVCTSGGHFGTR